MNTNGLDNITRTWTVQWTYKSIVNFKNKVYSSTMVIGCRFANATVSKTILHLIQHNLHMNILVLIIYNVFMERSYLFNLNWNRDIHALDFEFEWTCIQRCIRNVKYIYVACAGLNSSDVSGCVLDVWIEKFSMH